MIATLQAFAEVIGIIVLVPVLALVIAALVRRDRRFDDRPQEHDL